MAEHVITNTYNVLRGYSTDSKYVRDANVADLAINLMRLPDGTISPRRGYQVQIDEIGGLGNATFDKNGQQEAQAVCIHRDGNLYLEQKGSMTISFNDPNNLPESYISYEIYVDPDLVTDDQTCDFDPLLVMDDRALVNDCIKFRLKKVTAVSGESIGTGSASYSGTLASFPVSPGSILMTDGTLTVQDDGNGKFYGDIGAGTNTINYTTGAYSVNFSGATGAVTAKYKTTLQTQFDTCMGKGYGVKTPYKISQLVTALQAVTGVTVTTTGDTSYPGAFLEIAEETNIFDGGSVTLNWYYWESANRTVASTFSGLAAEINSDDFRIATFAAYEEALYIATKFDEIQKYDGQTVYRAGMPQGEDPTLTLTNIGSGGISDAGDYNYYVTYEQIDNNGRLVEGRTSDPVEITVGANDSVSVVVENLLQGSGWNTDGGLVQGTQTNVSTIQVDNGSGGVHSIQEGDTVYFRENPAAIVDGAQAGVNEIQVDAGHTIFVGNLVYFTGSTPEETQIKTITATTATTITFGGETVDVADNAEIATYRTRTVASRTANTITLAASENALESLTVSVTDNDPISNQLKINIYRTAVGGTNPYLVVSLPNDSYSATTTYLDNVDDDILELQRRYQFPEREPDPPPKTGVVVAFNGQLIFTQDPVNDDYVWFSEALQPEYVPQAENNFILPSNDDDVTGAGVAGSTLILFKERSIYAVSGNLLTSQFTVDSVAPGSNIGCVTHHSIKSVGALNYFLHSNGVYSIVENQLYPTDREGNPVPLSIMIDTEFREDKFDIEDRYVLKRATAVNYTKDNQYLLFLPAEEQTGPRASNNNSVVLCFDYLGKNWFKWTRMDAGGGWYVLNDNLFWQDRKRDQASISSKKYKQHRKYRLIDQVDHVTPIRTTWESSWEDLNNPRVRKKYIRTCLLFDDISAVFQENIPTLCYSSYKDWIENKVSTRVDVMQKINSSQWSTDQWNWISWSGYQDSFITVSNRGGTVAKAMKIQLQLNTINTSFKLQGFQHEIAKDFSKAILR